MCGKSLERTNRVVTPRVTPVKLYLYHTGNSVIGVSWATRNVWSAALPQAKNEIGVLVCANVFGLCWS
jgi:hypothetical protein